MTDYGYGNGNNYSTSYGAKGAADGGGFVAGEPQSSQGGGKVRFALHSESSRPDLAILGRIWKGYRPTPNHQTSP
jgi:hypothetical protein